MEENLSKSAAEMGQQLVFPLRKASENQNRNDCQAAAVLLCARANISVKDANGRTPLHYASEKDHGQLVELLDGRPVAAASPRIGDTVRGADDEPVRVTWVQVRQESKRHIVDLHTNSTKVSVTDCHRIPQELDNVMEANMFQKGDDLLVRKGSGCIVKEKLKSVTKRSRKVRVVQVEFENDATVCCFPSALLMKGSDPQVPLDQDGLMKSKDESADDFGDDLSENEPGVGSMQSQSVLTYPDTDDGF